MPASVQDKLKLTADQRKQIDALQTDADGKMDTLLKDEQKKQLKTMQDMMKTFAAGGPARGPGGPRGRGGFGPPGGPGGFATFGGTGGTAIFRAYRYSPGYPGLAGRDLTAGKTIEDLESQQQ